MLDSSHHASEVLFGWGTPHLGSALQIERHHRWVCHGTFSDLNNRRPQHFRKPKHVLIIAGKPVTGRRRNKRLAASVVFSALARRPRRYGAKKLSPETI